jgi:nucleotide-binding universal stress UspA family protein
MMKIVAGIDAAGNYEQAIRLLAKCGFKNAEVLLVHAFEKAKWLDMTFEAKANPKGGGLALQSAVELAGELGLMSSCCSVEGIAGAVLISAAEELNAELILVQSLRKGPLGSCFSGSTSRALALGAKQSILISKKGELSGRPLKALFATDHSEYCSKALSLLTKLNPQGISSIHVLSAVTLDDLQFRAAWLNTMTESAELELELQDRIQALNLTVCDTLRDAGFDASHSAPIAFLPDAIDKAMAEQNADLLIMGSQGHGFFERVVLGSRALHQVVLGDHNLLLLRPVC